MKRAFVIPGILILSFYFYSLEAQNFCKVLKPEIAEKYIGSCKQGLADGQGEATGIDYYRGEFSKGWPEGKGEYIWSNGATYRGEWKKGMRNGNGTYSIRNNGKDSTLTGKWKNDRFIGNQNQAPYVIEYRNNIGRVSAIRVGDRPYVKYKFSRNGIESTNISGLLMQGSSGSESATGSFTGFEQVTFPFKGKVSFSAPNPFQMAIIYCELRLTIIQPGSWIVTIFY
jgi:hypothetical protein